MVLGKFGKSGVFFIFMLALLLRTVGLSNFPPGFTPDEASFGYDAYSILHTGKDQWGHFFPLVLESFGDFKSPLYTYILIPFVGLFGLSEWVVRLPNALLGSFAVVVTYYLVLELGTLGRFGKSSLQLGGASGLKKRSKKALLPTSNYRLLACISAGLLAISPWHIMMSRGAFEANLTTFLMPLGAYGMLKGVLEDKNKWLYVSSFAFGLNLFSYHSAKVVTPLIFIFLLLLYRKELAQISKKHLFGYLGSFGFFVVLMIYTFTRGAGVRASDVSIFSGAMEAAAVPRLDAINSGMDEDLARILHNRYQISVVRFVNNYKQYFSYKYLFRDGPAEATYGMILGSGVLYLIELPLLFGFLLHLVHTLKTRSLKVDKEVLLILAWLLVAPIPAALATGPGYAGNRSVIMLPAIQITLSFGAYYWLQKVKSKHFQRMTILIYAILLVGSNFKFVLDYSLNLPIKHSNAMLYGRREMINYLKKVENKYETVVISRSLSEPQIYVAFYNEWDPIDYQNNANDWQRYKDDNLKFLDQLGEYNLGKYIFTSLENETYTNKDNVLFVGKPEEFMEGVNPRYIIKYLNGEDAIYVVDPENNAYANSQFSIFNSQSSLN